ncbi:type II toxin-antitoxin system RelE/ParE family toxin [Candidatus Peregrinibacteria bacterium]|nr:type II toxin-antitoxin system RelE/ParE family toxin [Candidatus Peregrinibacteria bacterium]
MNVFIFTKQAEKTFLKLPKTTQKRIILKLKELKKHDDILSVLKRLTNFGPATHRLRIGMYRLILELKNQKENCFEFFILDAGHRKDIYR